MKELSLQDQFAPKGRCFGCGPINSKGLRIKSFPEGDRLVARWKPETHHEAFAGVINGGILGALLDCHSNWTAAWNLKKAQNLPELPSTVTADFHVKLLRPTPSQSELTVSAWVVQLGTDRALIEAQIESQGKICAKCTGNFVWVKPGHPGFHRWD